ncbi:MAG TPA: YlxR family protein [Polyangia bacterium]|nr:YlxR family protein [Polyangia bacterium]
MSAPVRTCIGCRKAAPAAELARLALCDGRVVVIPPRGQRPGGRGASIHAQATCVRAALKAGAFARAFRTRIDDTAGLEPDSLLPLLAAATTRKAP